MNATCTRVKSRGVVEMGCDYYHEGPTPTDDYNDPVRGEEPVEFTANFTVWQDGKKVDEHELTFEVPPGAKVYRDFLFPTPPIWAR